MEKLMAVRLRRGDHVFVGRQWRQVKRVRTSRRGSGFPVVLLIFAAGPPMRVGGTYLLNVDRDARNRRAERR